MSESAFTIAVAPHSQPYRFHLDGKYVWTVPTHLHAGLYSIVGYEAQVAVDKQSIEELFIACGHGRDEFLRELATLATVPSAHLVLECSMRDILENPPAGDRTAPKSVYGSIIAWAERYAVQFWFCGDRENGERTTFTILDRWYRDHVLKEEEVSIFRRARRQAKAFINEGVPPVM